MIPQGPLKVPKTNVLKTATQIFGYWSILNGVCHWQLAASAGTGGQAARGTQTLPVPIFVPFRVKIVFLLVGPPSFQ